MKKMLVVLFALCLAFSVSFAETVDESFYVGTWVNYAFLKDGGFSVTMFHLSDDHTAHFLIRHVPADLDSSGRENIKTWSADGNNVSVVTGNTTLDLFVTDDYRLARDIYGGYEIYEKVGGPFASAGKPVDDSCISIPTGVYVAGEDFPAGTYRIELENDKIGGVVLLYESIDKVNTAFAYLYEYSLNTRSSSPVVGKIVINEGNALAVRNTTIILKPYEGLK